MTSELSHQQFVTQRRNLVLISVLVILFKVSKLTITEIDVLGNRIAIGQPQLIASILGLFFFYFLWRYYIACRFERGVDKFRLKWTTESFFIEAADAKKLLARRAKLPAGDIDTAHTRLLNSQNNSKMRCAFWITSAKGLSTAAAKAISAKVGKVHLNLVRYSAVKLRSLLKCAFSQYEFAEYVFPYVLALWALFKLAGFFAN